MWERQLHQSPRRRLWGWELLCIELVPEWNDDPGLLERGGRLPGRRRFYLLRLRCWSHRRYQVEHMELFGHREPGMRLV
jgi:hypothetical protein